MVKTPELRENIITSTTTSVDRWTAAALVESRAPTKPFAGLATIAETSRRIQDRINSNGSDDLLLAHELPNVIRELSAGDPIKTVDLPDGKRPSDSNARASIRSELTSSALDIVKATEKPAEPAGSGETVQRSQRYELSLFEPGNQAFVEYVDGLFGVTLSGLLSKEELTRLITPGRERQGVQDALSKPGSEVILYRKEERRRLETEYPARILDANFYKNLSKRYGIPIDHPERPGPAAEQFYLGNMKLANEVVREMKRSLFPYSDGQLGIRNEVDPPQHFPSRVFHMLISENASDKLRFELQRQLVLWGIAGEITARQWNYRLTAKLNDIMQVLDEQMFAGEIGSSVEQMIQAWHDQATGRVNRIEDPNIEYKHSPANARLKVHPIQMRQMLDMNEVAMLDLNEKSLATAIAKSVIVAKDRVSKGESGEIRPCQDAADMSRLVLVVKGGNEERQRVMDSFSKVISDPDNYDILSEVRRVKDDNNRSGRKGQAKRVHFKRIKIEFDDLPIDVEVQFFKLQDYLNSQLAIGRKTNGHYDGGAHDLYSRYRLLTILDEMFPADLYSDQLEAHALEYIDQIANNLLERSLEDKAA